MRTQKTLQLYFKPQPDFWMMMVNIYSITIVMNCNETVKFFRNNSMQIVGAPSERKTRDGSEYTEYKCEDAHEIVYQETLKQSYYMFRLFNGTFTDNLIGDNDEQQIAFLITKLNKFYSKVRIYFQYFSIVNVKMYFLNDFSVCADIENT